jgi:hypothetical protein
MPGQVCDLVLAESRGLQDAPQVADDITLLADDLVAHCHLELELLEAHRL